MGRFGDPRVDDLTKPKLLLLARMRGMKGYSGLTKELLIKKISNNYTEMMLSREELRELEIGNEKEL